MMCVIYDDGFDFISLFLLKETFSELQYVLEKCSGLWDLFSPTRQVSDLILFPFISIGGEMETDGPVEEC